MGGSEFRQLTNHMTTYQREARQLRQDFYAIRIRAVSAYGHATNAKTITEADRIWTDAYDATAKAEALIALADQLSPAGKTRRSKRVDADTQGTRSR